MNATNNLFLADLAGKTEDRVKDHIAENYAGCVSGFNYDSPTKAEKAALRDTLNGYDVLVAYESVGDYGCDSGSYFLIRNRDTQQMFEVRGRHCSWYGFEGQWDPEEVTPTYLLSDELYVTTGGYDDSAAENIKAVKAFVKTLFA